MDAQWICEHKQREDVQEPKQLQNIEVGDITTSINEPSLTELSFGYRDIVKKPIDARAFRFLVMSVQVLDLVISEH